MYKRMSILGIALLISFAAFAGEQGTPKPDQQLPEFTELDTDNSGNLSMDEAALLPDLAKIFKEVDADSNGLLTRVEYDNALTRIIS